MDPTVALKLAKAALSLPPVKNYIKRLPDPNTPTFIEARDEMFREWTAEHAVLIEENYRDLEARVEALAEKINERAEDHEAHAVYANYALQAYREPLDERRRMLVHAAAAIIDVRLSVAEHARVQRRLDELEPSEAVTLWAVANTCGRVFERREYKVQEHLRHDFWQRQHGAESLVAAGCVLINQTSGFGGGHTELSVTSFGRILLRVLRTYLWPRRQDIVVPGREILAGSRAEQVARDYIPSEMRSLLIPLTARAGAGTRYEAPKWSRDPNGEGLVPPPPNGAAWLQVEQLADDETENLSRFAPFDPQRDDVMHGRSRDTIAVQVLKHENRGAYVRVHGPHDVMRWLADDLDAVWT